MSRPAPPRVRLRPSVRVRLGPDRGFLFDERSGQVYSLNATGAHVAARLRAAAPTAAVIASVVETFEVDEATARRDLTRFVAQLLEEGLADPDG